MGFVDMFTDLISSLPFAEAQAEAPPAEEPTAADAPEEKEEEPEEEEEEEEVEDIKPKLEEECANSAKCAPAKHHFDECVERVTRNSEDPDFKGPHEDCVEECKFIFSYHVFMGVLPAALGILLRHSSISNTAQPNALPLSSSELSNKHPHPTFTIRKPYRY
ncbi:hypothetical protein RJZ90_006113 [Blastomyces dermatitidis]